MSSSGCCKLCSITLPFLRDPCVLGMAAPPPRTPAFGFAHTPVPAREPIGRIARTRQRALGRAVWEGAERGRPRGASCPCTPARAQPVHADMATPQTNATEPRQRGHAHNACRAASSEDARARPFRRPDPDPRTLDVRLPSARRSRFGLAEITRRNSHPAGCWLRCVRCSRGYSIGRARWLC